jgi:propanol-preferring alcohol dehydrogenase
MKAMQLQDLSMIGPGSHPLVAVDAPNPEPNAQEVLLEVLACGVCHTELDEIEGRTPPPRLPVVPGHEVVGQVIARGTGATRFQCGDRIGVGWVYQGSGDIDENLSPSFVATGRDVDGGYAQYMKVHQDYAYPIPEGFSDIEAAPLLCAGAIGYRALMMCGLRDDQSLGLMGFGASGHLTLQLARHLHPNAPVFVFARDQASRAFARSLGADWAGDIDEPPPEPLAAIIDTTPAWRPVMASLRALQRGGRLVINAIRKEDGDKSCLLDLNYRDHLWMEKEIVTVANITHHDLSAYLPLAAEAGIHPTTTAYPLDQANEALIKLKAGGSNGALVLVP